MRRIIIASVISVFIVAGGTVFGVRQYSHASDNVTAWDADVNGDGGVGVTTDIVDALAFAGQQVPAGARPVAEQNLDDNGNIRVHEQGTLNVNVVSQGTPGIVIPVLTNATIPGNQQPIAPPVFVDVTACKHLDIYGEGTSGDFDAFAYTSLDGSNLFGPVRTIAGNFTNLHVSFSGLNGLRASLPLLFGDAVEPVTGSTGFRTPYLGVFATSTDSSPRSGLNVWLYCTS